MHMTLRSKRAKKPLTDSHAPSSSPSSNVSINDLPCDMILEVFSYLDQDQLATTIPQVCARWETLHTSPTLYRRLTFTDDKPSTDEVVKLLCMATCLKSLELEDRTDTNAILECVSTSNQRLETLVLLHCKGSPLREAISTVTLRRVLISCNLLQHLSLEGSHCQSKNIYNEIGPRLPSLRSVDLGKPYRFDSQALLNIAANCPNLEELRAYHHRDCHCAPNYSNNDQIMSALCNQLQNLKIVHINIKNCTDESMHSLATCRQITDLRLYYNDRHITDIGIMAISDIPNLMRLTVCGNELISTHGWLAFLQRPIMRRLQELRLYFCVNFTQEVLNMIEDNPYDLRQLRVCCFGVHCNRFFNPGGP